MKPFTENLRYEYPLNKDSVVLDVGCHRGNFSKIISERYGCKVLAFEPISVFYNEAVEVLKSHPNIRCYHCGIGSFTRRERFLIKGDMSGAFADQGEAEEVQIAGITDVMDIEGIGSADLIKINIEGGEYELLEYLIANNGAHLFANIQVQFHPVVDDYVERHAAIRQALLQTHCLTYDAPWCWENYERIQVT